MIFNKVISTDPYLYPTAAGDRLLEEYKKYGSLVIGYDFDDTVYDYHKKGYTYDMVINLLRELKEIGCKLICWTASNDLNFVEKYLLENNIPCDGINANGIELGYYSRKPFYSTILDDRIGLAQVYNELNYLVKYINQKAKHDLL